MRWPRVAVLGFMIVVLSACGEDDGVEAASDTSVASVPVTTDPPLTTTTEAESEDLTAEAFLGALEEAGLPIGQSTIWDEATDPNELLGRPGQYVEKATWTDTRIECFSDAPGVDCGGDIEIFEDPDDRDERYEYLSGFADESLLGGYYQWRLPNAVVRIGFELTPSQAEEYAAVFEDLAPGEVEQLG